MLAADDLAQDTGRNSRRADQPGTRRTVWWLGGFMVAAALLRLPFVWTGLSTDEGGYAYVAQQWSRGASLYRSDWLDRPQGLLLTYRALLWLNDSGWTIRAGVVIAGVLLTGLIGVIAWMVVGRRAAVIAAGVYAVAGIGPHIEGMTLNGELLASVPATAAIACALWWRRRGGWMRLFSAGLLAGVAITMKQSGFDGVIVGLLIVALTAPPPGVPNGSTRVRRAAGFLAAFAIPIAACVIHAATIGLGRYWTALAGYQFAAIGGSGSNGSTRWHDFRANSGSVAWDIAALLVVALAGLWITSGWNRAVFGGWLIAGVLAINLGGSYWPHYYVQILPPLVVLSAIAIDRAIDRQRATASGSRPWKAVAGLLVAVIVVPTLIWMAALIPMSAQQRSRTIPYDALARRDDRIAAAIKAETSPSDRIYVLESEAYLYFAAQRQAPYPYLWGKPIQKIPGALPMLRDMLNSPGRPVLVVLDTPDPDTVDPTGGIRAALAAHYHPDKIVDGVPMLRAN